MASLSHQNVSQLPLTLTDTSSGNISGNVYDEDDANVSTSLIINKENSLPIDMTFNEGHQLAIIVYSVLMIFSSVGNISVLATILRWRKRQGRLTPMNLLLSHLATADLLVTLLMMPMEIAWNATVSWLAGDIPCRILSFTRIFGLYLSGFVLMCISLDRYYAVVHPLSIAQSRKRCRTMLFTSWLLSALCSSPQAVIFHVESHPTFTWYQQCVTFNSFPTPDYEQAYNFFVFVVLYGLPLATIITCYTGILWKIWWLNSCRRRRETQLRRSTMGTIRRAKARTLQLTIIIVFSFTLLWAPYQAMCLWYWLDPKSASQVDQRIQKGLFLFACTNSCMNPLIYGLFHFRNRNQRNGAAHNVGAVNPEGSIPMASSSSLTQPRVLLISFVGSGSNGVRHIAPSSPF